MRDKSALFYGYTCVFGTVEAAIFFFNFPKNEKAQKNKTRARSQQICLFADFHFLLFHHFVIVWFFFFVVVLLFSQQKEENSYFCSNVFFFVKKFFFLSVCGDGICEVYTHTYCRNCDHTQTLGLHWSVVRVKLFAQHPFSSFGKMKF